MENKDEVLEKMRELAEAGDTREITEMLHFLIDQVELLARALVNKFE